MQHIPVLGKTVGQTPSVFDILKPKNGERVLDATLGLGGHAKRFLELIGPSASLTALDADTDNIALANAALGNDSRVQIIHANFRDVLSLDSG